MNLAFTAITATIIVSLVSFVGVFIMASNKIATKTIAMLVSVAAGVMIGAAFFDLLPEAFEMAIAQTVLLWTLIGIVVAFLMERSFLWYHHHHDDTHTIKPSAYLVLFGDGVHNFVDGVAITTAFLASPAAGIATTVAIIAHEIPQELADYSILVNAGLKKKKALLYNFLSAVVAIAGAIVALYFLTAFEWAVPLALSFTAGMFIYIALADLVPELHHGEGTKIALSQTVSFIAGIALIALITSLTPHSHEHEEEYPAHNTELDTYGHEEVEQHEGSDYTFEEVYKYESEYQEDH